ncbi:aldehyde dehydrogenase family protein [Pimelobacter simplex]|uniref:aldehyde dehydrogenase family protein n=1 Tax=Nocardioides simplex TaxID=2045 RepID=UPI00215035CD|nr:aldehyde dehydrogenase family protein [Pimelobacter simplex]UUW91046.1 aldehyde dehydrogenase family protein [Pimelobacter simplex]UUW94874.1 aldehyde dehydrogenase family protein [Pimelobacter simplex]
MSVTSFDPRTGAVVATVADTKDAELRAVLAAATAAAPVLAATSPAQRRTWLHAVADALESHRDELARLADLETALGVERLTGEVTRAAGQLRFYAEVAAEGSYVDVTVDEPTATTPGLVRVNRPLGPVAVFGASNFPFAFSVLGNDTATALAAGCPVVAKAHPAHAGLSLRQAEIAREALAAAGAPRGTFAVVSGHQVGVDLVRAPEITAVGFTGSQAGGMALWRIAHERDVVIPVYAEMGTVNPVVVTAAGVRDIEAVAKGLVGSFTLGSGQFCTKPGLLLAPAGAGAAQAVADALRSAAPEPVMLTSAIADGVRTGLAAMVAAGAEVIAEVPAAGAGWSAPAAVLAAPAAALAPGSRLLEETFGAVVLVVEYADTADLAAVLRRLQPSLAASVFTGGAEDDQAGQVVSLLSGQVGRVAVDAWPTGVAFTWAQQHGGPWPATSAPAATSVGAAGLARFVRPVAYQSAPDAWLPPEAQAANPWGLPRRVDGKRP